MIALVRAIYRAVVLLMLIAIAKELGVPPEPYVVFLVIGFAAILILAIAEGD